MEPKYNPYIVYHTQQNIVLTCVSDDANPSNAVIYEWNSPSGTLNSQNFTIAAADNTHSGQYSCIAKNIAGTSNKTNKQISVHCKLWCSYYDVKEIKVIKVNNKHT